MLCEVFNHNGQNYIASIPTSGLLASENDALDTVAACMEFETQRVMLHHENLPEAFFQLRTGLAGAVLLKFANYHLRVAAVIPAEQVKQGRFRDMALETNRGNQFRIFEEKMKAVEWLVSQ